MELVELDRRKGLLLHMVAFPSAEWETTSVSSGVGCVGEGRNRSAPQEKRRLLLTTEEEQEERSALGAWRVVTLTRRIVVCRNTSISWCENGLCR